MAVESYVELPADSTGKRMRMREASRGGAEVVYEQYVLPTADPSWYVWGGSLACAANKHFLSILNTGAQVLHIPHLRLVNTAVASVTGIGLTFDVKRITACSGGSTITAQIVDTGDTALSSVTILAAPTAVTEGAVLFPRYTNNDEFGITGAFPTNAIANAENLLPDELGIRQLTLRQNEGITVKQITSSAVGTLGVFAVITKEP